MKLFCIVLVIYVLTLALCGVDGRGGGTRNGLEKSMKNYFRARRHATGEAALEGTQYGNEKPPPPPPQFRSRRDAANMSFNSEDGPPHGANDAPHMRQRRQMPPPPPPPPPYQQTHGMPPPPEGMPPPPSFT